MEMTYEQKARCPICMCTIDMIEKDDLKGVGKLILCRCPHCGNIVCFTNDKLTGSAKTNSEFLTDQTDKQPPVKP